ncbi:MAG: hypothetical protein FWE94_07810, partial [Coriobacteriia bacterium]|nr:hypothetical protein [Coriobacteriia bacterium]
MAADNTTAEAKPGVKRFGLGSKLSTGGSSPFRMLLLAACLFVVFVSPIIFQGFGQLFVVRIMAVVGLYVMLALGLNVVVGYAGLLNFGYIAFYAIGAYVGVLGGAPLAAWLAERYEWLGGLAYFAMIPFAALGGAIAGVALGAPVLRLRGDYLAIVTLGFGEIVRIVLNNNILGITNGAAGLPRAGQTMPKPFGFEFLKQHLHFSLPNIGSKGFAFQVNTNIYWYYVIVLLCLFAIFVVRRMDDSRIGRSWAAMREDDVAAASTGVSITGAKLWAFSLGALWGGIAGITFANFQGFVSPESFIF